LLVLLEPTLQLLAEPKEISGGGDLAALTADLACIARSVIRASLVQKSGRSEIFIGGRTEGALIYLFTGTDGLGRHVDRRSAGPCVQRKEYVDG
jgi:hypothetical protein